MSMQTDTHLHTHAHTSFLSLTNINHRLDVQAEDEAVDGREWRSAITELSDELLN